MNENHWQPCSKYRDSDVEWLGKIPVHWEVKRLKYAVTVNPEVLSEDTDLNYVLQYVDISNVDSIGTILETQEMRFENAPSRARRQVRTNDVIISTVRTYLRAIAFIDNPPDNLIVSTGFAVLRPTSELEPRYLWRLVQSSSFVDAVVAHSEGIGYPAIAPTRLADLPVWIPPLDEQRAIAAFLDRETARIDTLVAKQERLIALLLEKRAALISHTVTKGLDPNVPMKDSEIPSIGLIPAHWETRQNKHVFEERNERSVAGEEELLSVSHITGVTPRSEKEVYMFMAESMEGYKLCHPGDLVINTMWAWMGALGVTEYEGIVSPSYHVYRLRKKHASEYVPKYLDLLYRTPAYVCEITRHSKGVWTSRLRLYPDSFFDIQTVTPPRSEQIQIVTHVSKQIQRMDELVNKSQQFIGLLQEYRTALISAAVTGKIDVR